MFVCQFGGFATARSALDETLFDEVWFIYILYRTCIFTHGCGNGIETDRTTFELINDRAEQLVVNLI